MYAPYLAWRPPGLAELLPAFGLACLMAVTFGVTTEAIKRGPLGSVSPITALSPALTAILAIALLRESLAAPAYAGIAVAPLGVILLSTPRRQRDGDSTQARAWLPLAVLSLLLQGVGAFIAKVVVTPSGPSALLLMGALVQVMVGLALAPPWRWSAAELRGRPAKFTLVAYSIAAVATIVYLLALSTGPAAVIVPLVATSPALAGLLGIVVLRERAGGRQFAGISLALAGAILLAAA